MKWFKENWLVILLIGILLVVLTIDVKRSNDHKGEIKAKNDSIASLELSYQILEDHVGELAKMVESDQSTILLYQDSLQFSSEQLINQKYRYEKAMADLSRIPTDSLYRQLTGQLDSLSFHW